MSGSSYYRSQTPWAQQGESSSSRITPQPGPSLPPIRYPGDGLDFRRPARPSTEPGSVIDLTDEPDSSPHHRHQRPSPSEPTSRNGRQPRFGRDILTEPDVVDLVDEPDSPGDMVPPSSPEVQFVRATSRPRRNQTFRSEVLNMYRRALGQTPFPDDLIWANRFLHSRSRPADEETIWIGEGPARALDVILDPDVLRPLQPTPAPAPPRSSYKPPSPAPEGFTRSASEDDVVVCPNCDMELGTGDEVKQQIWVAKQCGHVRATSFWSGCFTDVVKVYCGECARHRAVSKSKKSGLKTKPFSKCQIPDCGKSVSSPKSMIQIYL